MLGYGFVNGFVVIMILSAFISCLNHVTRISTSSVIFNKLGSAIRNANTEFTSVIVEARTIDRSIEERSKNLEIKDSLRFLII